MNKHERRELWARKQSDIATAKADRDAAFSHHSLFDSLPKDLNDLLQESFAARACRPSVVEPSQFGYLHEIDGRPVEDAEHDIVCRTLVAQLKAIVEWCREREIDLSNLIDMEYEAISAMHCNPWVNPEPDEPSKSRRWLLDAVGDLANGDEKAALEDLMQMGKRVPIETTMSNLRVGIDAIINTKHGDALGRDVAPEASIVELPFKEVEPPEFDESDSVEPCSNSSEAEVTPEASNAEPPPKGVNPPEFVDSDYVEPYSKRNLALLFDVCVRTLNRKLQRGIIRSLPGTAKSAKMVRIHGDDIPPEIRRPHERKQKLLSMKQKTN